MEKKQFKCTKTLYMNSDKIAFEKGKIYQAIDGMEVNSWEFHSEITTDTYHIVKKNHKWMKHLRPLVAHNVYLCKKGHKSFGLTKGNEYVSKHKDTFGDDIITRDNGHIMPVDTYFYPFDKQYFKMLESILM